MTDIVLEQRLERIVGLGPVGRPDVLAYGIRWPVRVGSDRVLEGIGDRHFRLRLSRKSEFLELGELRRDRSPLREFPGFTIVVIDEAKQRLLFSAMMAVNQMGVENPAFIIVASNPALTGSPG